MPSITKEVVPLFTPDDLRFFASRHWSITSITKTEPNKQGWLVTFERAEENSLAFDDLERYLEESWPRPCCCGSTIDTPRHWDGHLALNLAGEHRLQVPDKIICQFRRYEMSVGDKAEWLTLGEASRRYRLESPSVNFGQPPSVNFGQLVREFDGRTREMTAEDRVRITGFADEPMNSAP